MPEWIQITEGTPGPWRESSTRMLDILQVTDPGCCGMRLVDEDGCLCDLR